MKTAVCLSGQARFIDENMDNLLENIILPTEADVFCHFWATKGPRLEPYLAVEKLPITAALLEKQKVFDEMSWRFIDHDRFDFQNKDNRDKYQRVHSMFDSLLKANALKRVHELDQGFLYDCVIRCRTDICFERPFDFSEFNQDPDAIWLCNLEERDVGMACADLFAFSNSPRMDFYSSCFTNLPTLLEASRYLFAENLLYDHLEPVCNIALSAVRYSIVRS